MLLLARAKKQSTHCLNEQLSHSYPTVQAEIVKQMEASGSRMFRPIAQ